ncbi:methyltransferase domain-containing protein [Bacteroidota bacterium]
MKIILEENPQRIIEAGVGTGRLFLPLINKASRNTVCIGIDISKNMLKTLAKNLKGKEATLIHADICDKRIYVFDKANTLYTFATLHILTNNWKKAIDNFEYSITPNTGKIILIEEINSVFHGSENLFLEDDYRLESLYNLAVSHGVEEHTNIVQDIFKHYHKLRSDYGLNFMRFNSQIFHGDQSPAERYLRSKGFSQRTIQKPELRWIKPHTIKDITDAINEGTVTTLGSDMPDEIRKNISEELLVYCEKNNYPIEKNLFIPSEIQVNIFERL